MMKWTKYHIRLPKEGKVVLINYRNNTLMALDCRLDELINQTQNVDALQELHPTFYEELCRLGFLVNDDADEAESCIEEKMRRIHNESILKITINPTLDCNLRCWYCYEEHLNGSCMSEETMASIRKYVEIQCQNSNLSNIELSFFGGEPLLKFECCVNPLITAISELCRKYNKLLTVTFTTNAVLLDKQVVDWLCDRKLPLFLQIPFDGGREMHNKTKRDAEGRGCYDVTLRNMCYALSRNIPTVVRCNYTDRNILSFQSLLEDLKDVEGKCHAKAVFQQVWQEHATSVLNNKVTLLSQKAREYGLMPSMSENCELGYNQELCYADMPNNVVFNYNGDVYQCTARKFTEANRVGVLQPDGHIAYNAQYTERRKTFILEDCKECLMLPICEVCSQKKYESADGKCPVRMTRETALQKIHERANEIISQGD